MIQTPISTTPALVLALRVAEAGERVTTIRNDTTADELRERWNAQSREYLNRKYGEQNNG
jgi:hypothetical protein